MSKNDTILIATNLNVSKNKFFIKDVEITKDIWIQSYLGSKLDWDQLWRRVQDKIKSIPFLHKKLKRIGFKPAILINVYVSLVLSYFAYSSPLLISTSKSSIKEMKIYIVG